MENEIVKLLSEAVDKMEQALPMIEKLEGKIPTEILSLLDRANAYSVMY
jgi:hypothetical protein